MHYSFLHTSQPPRRPTLLPYTTRFRSARVRLVQDGEAGFEHRHLEDLVPLLLAAREPVVQVPAEEALVEPEELHLLGHDAHEVRSEEHTSELQSRFDLVCRLLLEKKKQ